MATLNSNILAEADAISDLKTAVTGILVGCEVHLGKSNITPDRDTDLATLTAGEADYDGYAPEAVTFSVATLDDANRIETIGVVGEFRPTGSTTPNVIYYAWTQNGDGLLIAAWRIQGAPITMGSALDSYTPTVRLRPGFTGDVTEVT